MTALKNIGSLATLALIWAFVMVAVGFVGRLAWWLVNLGWSVL